ncbi:hypothetical protein RRG08_054349 [Elysia crispata]|uniref:Uncharacterized protein n=1 Tax=Elysia crispata TaxID=231223 RepID=A0AAE1B438_9GAST|nr:hypothetical protein RRG08_054349 [Elysia crispata]
MFALKGIFHLAMPTRQFDEIISDIDNKTKVIDDTIVWSQSIEDSSFQTVKFLDICGRNGVILSPSKFSFAKETVHFAGFLNYANNCSSMPTSLGSNSEISQAPHNHRREKLVVLCKPGGISFASAEKMQPFHTVLPHKTPFIWTEELDNLFKETKAIIIQEIQRGVEIFDKNKPTCLATDFSKDSIGL